MHPDEHVLTYHENPSRFRDALSHSASVAGFSARLIEKDYYCSMILQDVASVSVEQLVFKGGTCLAKVYANFYRLSEDLDFAIPAAVDTTRGARRRKFAPLKEHFAGLSERLPCLRSVEEFTGHNQNRQYIGRCSYRSLVTGQDEFVKVEISLREVIVEPVEKRPAITVLIDPYRGLPVIQPILVDVLSVREAYAEKLRAALTRREPAVRDFYDVHHAIGMGILDPFEDDLLQLVRRKLALPDCEPVDTSPEKLRDLSMQVESQLRPVLRVADYDSFDLPQAFGVLARVADAVQKHGAP